MNSMKTQVNNTWPCKPKYQLYDLFLLSRRHLRTVFLIAALIFPVLGLTFEWKDLPKINSNNYTIILINYHFFELEPAEIRLLLDPLILLELAILLWPQIYYVMLFLYFLISSKIFILLFIYSFILHIFYYRILLFVDRFIFLSSSVEWFSLFNSLLLRFIFQLFTLLVLFSFLLIRLLIYSFCELFVWGFLPLWLYRSPFIQSYISFVFLLIYRFYQYLFANFPLIISILLKASSISFFFDVISSYLSITFACMV